MDNRIKTQSELREDFSRLLQDFRVQIPNRVVGDLLGISRGHVHNLLNRDRDYRLRANTRFRMALFNQCLAAAIEQSAGGVSTDELREVVRQMMGDHGLEYLTVIDPVDELVLNFSELTQSTERSKIGLEQSGSYVIVAALDADNLTGKSIKGTAIWLRVMLWLKGVGAEVLTSAEFEDKVLISARVWPSNVIILGGEEVDSDSHRRITEVLEDTGRLETITWEAFFKVKRLGEKNFWQLTGEDGDSLRQGADSLLKTLLSPTEQ